jgi:adenylate cyclase
MALIDMYGGPDSRYLNFYGPARIIRTIPYHEVLAETWDPTAAGLQGKAVFVGFSERHQPEQQDAFYSAYSQRSGVNLSGVEIGATAFANLLDGQSVRPLSIPAHLAVVFIWGFALALVLMLLPVRIGLGAAVLAGPMYFGLAYQQFQAAVWLPVMVPLFVQIPAALLGAFGLKYAQAKAQGARVRKALGYYLPARVADRLARQAGEVGVNTQLLHGTCLVTDAEQYTALAENLPPQELHGLLNEYYAVLFREVEVHGGFVSDVVGDSMVAVWASAEPDPAAHARACRASLEMLRAVQHFNASKGQRELPTRIGLHSGEVLLGDVGAESHFEYRAVGDIVSTASRIQGLNKQLDTKLLVSSETLADATGVVSRKLGRFLLVGKEVPVELHELLGNAGEVAPPELELIDLFTAALDTFNTRHWAEAHAAFSRILECYPTDGPSGFYARLGMKYLAQDPGPAWQGTVRIAEK